MVCWNLHTVSRKFQEKPKYSCSMSLGYKNDALPAPPEACSVIKYYNQRFDCFMWLMSAYTHAQTWTCIGVWHTHRCFMRLPRHLKNQWQSVCLSVCVRVYTSSNSQRSFKTDYFITHASDGASLSLQISMSIKRAVV